MPRRGPNLDHDSQKENQDIRASTSRTKIKVERSKRAGVSNSRSTRAAARVESDDEQNGTHSPDEQQNSTQRNRLNQSNFQSDDMEGDDIQRHDDGDGVGENGSPKGRKRARLNGEGEGRPVKNEGRSKAPRRVTLPRDKDGYVPGSIVRVQLENFVTYDFVEFRPGPNLNMIFGPNGTGKSSIACAICIGLNGAPSLLGRSNELNAFVKHGHDKGYVEIELKGKIGMANLVIRRSINSKNKSSQFTLNGSPVTGRDINDRIAELNVHVGNLCSFLPQDRVSEFAQMSPQQLLKETQRTAGDEHLTIWHNTLIEKGKELKIAQKMLQDDTKHAEQLEAKQKSMEKDVKRYRERRAIERQIQLLEMALPYVEYRESKLVYDQAKLERDRAAGEYRQMEERNKPMKLLQEELNKQDSDLELQRRDLKDGIRKYYSNTTRSVITRNKEAADRAEEALDKIKAIKRSEKDLARNKARTKEEIAKCQEKVDNPPEYESIEPIVDEIKAIKEAAGNLKVERTKLCNRIGDLIRQETDNKRTIDEKEQELKEQENYMKRKVAALQNWDRDCAEVVIWLLNHKETNEFAKRVDLPAVVDLDIHDKRYAKAVEGCFNANQLKTFITHNEEDYNTFNRMFIDTPEALGRKVRVTVWYRPQNLGQLLQSSVSPDELRHLGFDGYAIDFVMCSEGMRWFLAKELNMHRTPIALDSSRVNDNGIQAALSKLGPDGRPLPGSSYVSGDMVATVSRSAYGQRKIMTVTKNLRPARNLVHPTVDLSIKRAIDEQITGLQKRNKELQVSISELQTDDQDIQQKLEALKLRHEELTVRRNAVARAVDAIAANKAKLELLKKRLSDYENQPSPEEERGKYKAVVEKTVKDRTKILTELVDLIKKTIMDQSSLAVMSLKQIQLTANVQAIDTLCNERTAEAKRIKQAFEDASERYEAAKQDSKRKVHATREKLGGLNEELQATFRALEEEDQQKPPEDRWTSENVTAALETEKAKLDLNNATDSGVIEAYEARQREIENLRDAVARKERTYRKLEQKLQVTRDLWYPALTDLITAVGEKFSAAFDRVHCAGEIRIAENEDYEKWAIEILVKFRDGEPLTLLTGQRQSGGERSLTTILYLMSLTEHARAPFSLVDEINQGMDHTYERAVHSQLVEVTCKADAGQYFLITPKLLPGLKYHRSMKILCVNNGEWLPESTSPGVGNMRRMIDNFAEKRRPGPSAR